MWNEKKLNDGDLSVWSKKFSLDNIHKLKKSLNLSEILRVPSYMDIKNSKKLLLNETKRLWNTKFQRDGKNCNKSQKKNLKLCPKSSLMNLKENTSVCCKFNEKSHMQRFPNDKLKSEKFDPSKGNMKRNSENTRLPHQPFQIQETTSLSVQRVPPLSGGFLQGRCKNFITKNNYTQVSYPVWTIPSNRSRVLYDCLSLSVPRSTGVRSWENILYKARGNFVADTMKRSSMSHKTHPDYYQCVRAIPNIKVPILFEEICGYGRNKVMEHEPEILDVSGASLSANVGETNLQVMEKISNSQYLCYTHDNIPFGISKCCCSVQKNDKKRIFMKHEVRTPEKLRKSILHTLMGKSRLL